MARSIDALTPAGRSRMAPWVAAWIERELSCQPAEWDAFEEGARRCYASNDIAWPKVGVRVASPLAGMVAALPIKAALSPASLIDCVVDGYPSQALGWAAFALGILAEERGPATPAAERWFAHVDAASLPPQARLTAREARRMARDGELRDPMSVAVTRAVQQAFEQTVLGEDGRSDPRGWQPPIAHFGDIQFLFWDVEHAIRGTVDAGVLDEVRKGIAEPILDTVRKPVEMAVWEGVRRAVGAQNAMTMHTGGWGLAAHAAREFLREACRLELADGLWDGHLAYRQACTSAGWWCPGNLFLLVSDRPSEIHLRPDGPAIVWRDGTAFGTREGITPRWNAYPWKV